jgi:hypothetical protein
LEEVSDCRDASKPGAECLDELNRSSVSFRTRSLVSGQRQWEIFLLLSEPKQTSTSIPIKNT